MVVFPRNSKGMKKAGRRRVKEGLLSDILTLKITYRKCSEGKDVFPADLAMSRARRKYEEMVIGVVAK